MSRSVGERRSPLLHRKREDGAADLRHDVLRNVQSFDDAPNGCVLPLVTALGWVVASVQEVSDRPS